ncbi:hypothetical protein CSC94_22910 [Zhengella mangrovi]|uniref:Tail specific protease domain-containing protein n=1 Tax=Zhengella mangrovi TaxID=1982044 RepID=A0A2G1QGS4_9HYPH|nr:S41 family peptidase [Zhengella mangrovi]PHP64727.1 hypothetical protein CSC94_22910 [Zhengella mangrovi]
MIRDYLRRFSQFVLNPEDVMGKSDAIENFEIFWKTFNDRYPFFELRGVDWKRQYELFRPKVHGGMSEAALFEVLCDMIRPLKDGHVEIDAEIGDDDKYFNPEDKARFYQEFSEKQIKKLFETTEKTLMERGFGKIRKTDAWMLTYSRSDDIAYMRILELEGIKKRKLTTALDRISKDFPALKGIIVDIRDCPGGDDDIVIAIVSRFTDQRRTVFHRKTKQGPGADDLSELKSWHVEPEGEHQFTGPIALLTCDAVFSGGEVFALAMKQLPHVTIIGDRTAGIFSYQLEKTLPNGWDYNLSYQIYYSPDMVCYEGAGVPVDIEFRNTRRDLETGEDSLVVRALDHLNPPMV